MSCPGGKFQRNAGRAFCESVPEGQFVSSEPAESVGTRLSLPNANVESVAAVEKALLEKLAEELGTECHCAQHDWRRDRDRPTQL